MLSCLQPLCCFQSAILPTETPSLSEVHVLLTIPSTSGLAPVPLFPTQKPGRSFKNLIQITYLFCLEPFWCPIILRTKPKTCLHVWPYIMPLTPRSYMAKLAFLLFLKHMLSLPQGLRTRSLRCPQHSASLIAFRSEFKSRLLRNPFQDQPHIHCNLTPSIVLMALPTSEMIQIFL